jgi:hypothetical protein
MHTEWETTAPSADVSTSVVFRLEPSRSHNALEAIMDVRLTSTPTVPFGQIAVVA